MKAAVRRKIEMAARVRDFIRAHPVEGASYTNARTHFEERLARIEVLVAQHQAGMVASRAASDRRQELRRALHSQLLRHLIGVGRVAGKDQAELAGQFKVPGMRGPHLAFLNAAKGMIAKAAEQKELLVSQGMSENLLDDLGRAVTAFEAANTASREARRNHVGARADLEVSCVEIMEQIRLLDGLVRYRFGDNPELLAAWDSARNLPTPSGKTLKKGTEASPPSEGGVAPAA